MLYITALAANAVFTSGLSTIKADRVRLWRIAVLEKAVYFECVAYEVGSEQSHCIEVNETLAPLV